MPVLERPLPELGGIGEPQCGRRSLAEKAEGRKQGVGGRVGVDGTGEGLLRQLFAGGIGGHRQMGVARRGQAEQALQVNLASGGVEQVGAAHDVGDAGVGIVDHHRELISEQAVGTQHHVIARVGGEVFLLPALNAILKPTTPCARTRQARALRPAGRPSRQVPG